MNKKVWINVVLLKLLAKVSPKIFLELPISVKRKTMVIFLFPTCPKPRALLFGGFRILLPGGAECVE